MNKRVIKTRCTSLYAFVLVLALSQSLISVSAQPGSDAEVQTMHGQINALLNQLAAAADFEAEQELLTQAMEAIEDQHRLELASLFEGTIQFPLSPVTPESVPGNTAIIYSVTLADRLLHLVLHDSLLQAHVVDISENQLDRAIKFYDEELQISTSFGGLERASIELYSWLVAPFVEGLREADVENIVFIRSSTIRRFPMAALFDGQRYLNEEFALASSLGLAQTLSDTVSDAGVAASPQEVESVNNNAGLDLSLSLIGDEVEATVVMSARRTTQPDDRLSLELNSAYLAVGAAAGIVSLWRINEEARASLVAGFTAGMQSGLSKVESLRRAQLELKAAPRFSHPYYWSSFRLVGNWQ